MIQTSQSVPVRVGIDTVWDYVKDIRRWAELMPGLQDCEILSEDDSRWILKVGVGGLVRTVKVDVHVEQWDAPERVSFSFKLQGDPVKGGGTYSAMTKGPDAIEMTLALRVEGSGPMAPMWEAMGARRCADYGPLPRCLMEMRPRRECRWNRCMAASHYVGVWESTLKERVEAWR